MPTKISKLKRKEAKKIYNGFVKSIKWNTNVILNKEGLAVFMATKECPKTKQALERKIEALDKKIELRMKAICKEIGDDAAENSNQQALKERIEILKGELKVINDKRKNIRELAELEEQIKIPKTQKQSGIEQIEL